MIEQNLENELETAENELNIETLNRLKRNLERIKNLLDEFEEDLESLENQSSIVGKAKSYPINTIRSSLVRDCGLMSYDTTLEEIIEELEKSIS